MSGSTSGKIYVNGKEVDDKKLDDEIQIIVELDAGAELNDLEQSLSSSFTNVKKKEEGNKGYV